MNEQQKKQMKVVYYHRFRAKKDGLPATLTLEEWLKTLDSFHWKCAYCLEAPYEALDHFIPLKQGVSPFITLIGGTTANNCIPACKVCNDHKRDNSPEHILKSQKMFHSSKTWHPHPFPPIRVIKRISKYLKISF